MIRRISSGMTVHDDAVTLLRSQMAEAWHDASDHGRDGDAFGSPLCNCNRIAARAIALGWEPGTELAATLRTIDDIANIVVGVDLVQTADEVVREISIIAPPDLDGARHRRIALAEGDLGGDTGGADDLAAPLADG